MPRASQGTSDISVDAQQFVQLVNDVKAFDPTLARGMRRNLRDAAKVGARAAQREVLRGPAHGHQHTGLRAKIAAGITVQVATSARGRAGVFIRATSKRLPESQKSMARAYNKPSFRHPVFDRSRLFGLRRVFVTQRGHPYYYDPIQGEEPKMRALVEKALNEATDKLAKGGTQR